MKLWPALVICALMAVVVAADGVPTVVTYVPHDKVTATMARGGSIVDAHGLVLLSQRRGAGEVEWHENTTPVFIIVEGEATFGVAGTRARSRETPEGKSRASAIQGGETRHLS